LIPTAGEADVWMQMLDNRNQTSHAYDEELAARIYRNIVKDYAPLLNGFCYTDHCFWTFLDVAGCDGIKSVIR
jgi:hypothetical protein